MRRSEPAGQKVRTTVLQLLEKSSTIKLPSIRELARGCEVSIATAWKEIKRLEKEGVLVTKWGHQTSPAALKTKEIPKKDSEWPKWKSVREKLKKEIQAGVYPPETMLPSRKMLQAKYGISFQTLTKSLQALGASGIINRKGYRYIVSPPKPRQRWRPTIVVIGAGIRPGTPKIESERERDFYHFLLVEAQTAQVNLEFITYDDWSAQPVFYTPQGKKVRYLSENEDVLGYLVSSWHIKNLNECLISFPSSKKQVSVWIENPSGYSCNQRSACTFYNIGYSPLPGQQMGDYLLGLGHREVAYISPFHGSTWSQDRLCGLVHSFEKAGPEYRVHPFTPGNAESEWSFTDEIIQQNGTEELLDMKKITRNLPIHFESRCDRLKSEGLKLLRDARILDVLKEPIHHILENKEITAVVAANDLCALLILNFLKWLKVPIPQRLSIAGFDDTFEGLAQGLSSYSFNTRSLVKEMIENATSSSSERTFGKTRFFEGRVVERGSTGVAEKHITRNPCTGYHRNTPAQ
ncbi:MAG: substrate-binding domain-containing protein [Chitinispirillaceae bacterium]